MSSSYSPRAGSVADRVIHHLRTLAPRAELTSAALAEALGIEHNATAPAWRRPSPLARCTCGARAAIRARPQFWSLHEHAGATAPHSRQNGAQEDDGLPIRRIVPANGAPPLPIVPPLFAPLAEAAEHAVPETWTAGQQVSARDLIEPPAPTTAAPAVAAAPAADHQDLRFALWSDGSLELRRGSGLMALLLPDETRALVNYLERLAETAS